MDVSSNVSPRCAFCDDDAVRWKKSQGLPAASPAREVPYIDQPGQSASARGTSVTPPNPPGEGPFHSS